MWQEDVDTIMSIFTHYFQDLFRSSGMGAVQMSQVLEFVPRTITKLMNAQLWSPFDQR